MQPRPDTDFVHDMRVRWGDCDPARIANAAHGYLVLTSVNAT